jgi:hypothetical protein
MAVIFLRSESISRFEVLSLAAVLSVCYITFFVGHYLLLALALLHLHPKLWLMHGLCTASTMSALQSIKTRARTFPGLPFKMANGHTGIEGPSSIREFTESNHYIIPNI